MLYTIGNKANYFTQLKTYGKVYKAGKRENYVGGYIFLTKEDAIKRIQEAQYKNFAVFGVDTSLSNTEKSKDGWWYALLTDAPIIFLSESKNVVNN